MTRDECDREAKANKALANQAARQGDKQIEKDARDRAIELEKCRDSWLYRTFGW